MRSCDGKIISKVVRRPDHSDSRLLVLLPPSLQLVQDFSGNQPPQTPLNQLVMSSAASVTLQITLRVRARPEPSVPLANLLQVPILQLLEVACLVEAVHSANSSNHNRSSRPLASVHLDSLNSSSSNSNSSHKINPLVPVYSVVGRLVSKQINPNHSVRLGRPTLPVRLADLALSDRRHRRSLVLRGRVFSVKLNPSRSSNKIPDSVRLVRISFIVCKSSH